MLGGRGSSVREGLGEKARVEGVSSERESIACGGNGHCKGLEVGVCLAAVRKSTRLAQPEQSEQRGDR